MPTDPTARFSNRVDDYVRYRPSYPAGVLEILRAEVGLTPASIIADVVAAAKSMVVQLRMARDHRSGFRRTRHRASCFRAGATRVHVSDRSLRRH